MARIGEAEFERSAAEPGDWPPVEESLPEVAFCGRSNVGKSSLLNLLGGRRGLARVSRTPGRTRLTNFFRLAVVDGDTRKTLRLVDLPGFGYAHVSKAERATWRPAIEAYLSRRAGLRAVVLLVDARRGVAIDERELAKWLAGRGVAVIPAVTKCDKLAKHERPLVGDAIGRALGGRVVLTSADDNAGADELWRRILAAIA